MRMYSVAKRYFRLYIAVSFVFAVEKECEELNACRPLFIWDSFSVAKTHLAAGSARAADMM